MDATFTQEQHALREATSALLADHCPIERVRETFDSDTGTDLELYRRLAELGATDLPGATELGIVLEECGRHAAPVPLATGMGIAAAALATADPDSALLTAARAGDAIPALLVGDDVVPEAHVATHILAADDGHLTVYEAADCDIRQVPTMDASRRLCAVDLGNAAGERIGPAAPALSAARRHGCVALAHELVGVGQACLDRAVTHAKTREQFGKPIGTYQAVSHRCAEMFVALEAARGHAYFAAWATDADAPEADLAASQAKAAAGEAAVYCAQSAIQVHGGIGFTWEHDLHLYLKRARAAAAFLGTPEVHRQRIADLIGV